FVRSAVPLAPFTWFKVGGAAQYFAEPSTAEELTALVKRCHQAQVPIHVLGSGSNVLVRDAGVTGVVLHLSSPAWSQVTSQGRAIVAAAGARLGQTISVSVGQGLAGLESLVGIPGTIGAALRCNAGGRAGDIGQWTSRVTAMSRSGEIVERGRDDLVFTYRQSNLDELVILSAEFQLEQDDPLELAKRMQKQWIVKKAAQPLSHERTGCIFRNPRGMSAGMLIEQAGLKGTRQGGAEVSQRHGNFIVADPDAKSSDIIRLIELVRERIFSRMGIELETLLEIW
ncbi:MAG: UDP-N-acetylmuramate dehydrogenase, partial [Pirellulales bacterium]